MVLSFHFLKPYVMSSINSWCDRGDERLADNFFSSVKYSFWSDERGKLFRSTVPRKSELPKRLKLSLTNKYLNGLIMNDVPWTWERWEWLRKIRYFPMSSGLITIFHWLLVSDDGMMFQGIYSSIDISIYLLSLAFFLLSIIFYTTIHLLLVLNDN